MSTDLTCDVVVLGTGAAGFVAAIRAAHDGASVGLFEKAESVGGTTAWSGGMAWVPCNAHMKDIGVEDSREEALTYLHGLSPVSYTHLTLPTIYSV